MISYIVSAVSLVAHSLAEPGLLPDGPCHVPLPQGYSTNSGCFGLIMSTV